MTETEIEQEIEQELAAARRWCVTESGRIKHDFEPAALALSLLMLPAVLVQDTFHGTLYFAAGALGALIWAAFAAELVWTVEVAPHKRLKALALHWPDLLVVVLLFPLWKPLLVAAGAAKAVRAIRLSRLLAVAGRAFRAERLLKSRKSIHYAAALVAMMVFASGIGVAETDPTRFPDPWRGVWWAVVTVTTVGYGDTFPTSPLGRMVAVVLMLIGIGFLSLVTASVASHFIHTDSDGPSDGETQILAELKTISTRLAALEKKLDS